MSNRNGECNEQNYYLVPVYNVKLQKYKKDKEQEQEIKKGKERRIPYCRV